MWRKLNGHSFLFVTPCKFKACSTQDLLLTHAIILESRAIMGSCSLLEATASLPVRFWSDDLELTLLRRRRFVALLVARLHFEGQEVLYWMNGQPSSEAVKSHTVKTRCLLVKASRSRLNKLQGSPLRMFRPCTG